MRKILTEDIKCVSKYNHNTLRIYQQQNKQMLIVTDTVTDIFKTLIKWFQSLQGLFDYIYIILRYSVMGPLIHIVSSERSSSFVASYDKPEVLSTYSNPEPYGQLKFCGVRKTLVFLFDTCCKHTRS